MDTQNYRGGVPPEGGMLVESFPRPPSRFPAVLQPLLDRYDDPNADGSLFLVTAAVAIEDAWAYVDGVKVAGSSEAGPCTLYLALESLARWQVHERLSVSAHLRERFTDLSAAVCQYFRMDAAASPPLPDPPLECLLVEVGWFVDALVQEVAPDFLPL
jgi:hypothetical protein